MTRFLAVFVAVALLAPAHFSLAASSIEVSGWVPWWQDTMGLKSATKQLSKLDSVYAFAFEVESDGSLKDKADLDESQWEKFFRSAKRADVEVIPSVMWSDGASIHSVLSDKEKREDHIDEIVEMVEDGDFDGVNIDYEGKLSETKDYFSLFLEELKEEMDDKLLTCAIEARTPPESLYNTVPKDLEYANDYEEIAKHCDVVELMTYDQQRADLDMNDLRKGEPYMPVADTAWVEKVLQLALKDIPADKIRLGVPTYGRQWTVTVAPEWYRDYTSKGAINLPDAEEVAEENDVEAARNAAGEASFTFFDEKSPFKILDALPVPDGTRAGFEAAAKALLFANYTKMDVPIEMVWYSDAAAISEKVDLIEKYALNGIAIFKIDGEEDQGIWKLF
ncbi:hypothetical protein A2837_01795 [Candidatus Kaiserbacteria bacterium RIFCSPHIGHO2_01_FULL_46_22]|uniref:GH18 domain-containing protein n=1 Tax=Candidatus Kaiserbacteria bacterium RIFCSPHIGHO2_01_FULL_46_22 TaxID=1798475 RepID=A0A1F6BYM3_9BACT|nr:MAG: hypothetical protein A2837_01795 [Candidatus Kaiserbacteria bacterium RIFCSPHIGHO2_01_FULL_46_22]